MKLIPSIIVAGLVSISATGVLYALASPADFVISIFTIIIGVIGGLILFLGNGLLVASTQKLKPDNTQSPVEIFDSVTGIKTLQTPMIVDEDEGCFGIGCGDDYFKYILFPFYDRKKKRFVFGKDGGTANIVFIVIACLFAFMLCVSGYQALSQVKSKREAAEWVGVWNLVTWNESKIKSLRIRFPLFLGLLVFLWIGPWSKLLCLLSDDGEIEEGDVLSLPVIGAWPIYDGPEDDPDCIEKNKNKEPGQPPDECEKIWKGGCKHTLFNWLLFIIICLIYIDIFTLIVSPTHIPKKKKK